MLDNDGRLHELFTEGGDLSAWESDAELPSHLSEPERHGQADRRFVRRRSTPLCKKVGVGRSEERLESSPLRATRAAARPSSKNTKVRDLARPWMPSADGRRSAALVHGEVQLQRTVFKATLVALGICGVIKNADNSVVVSRQRADHIGLR